MKSVIELLVCNGFKRDGSRMLLVHLSKGQSGLMTVSLQLLPQPMFKIQKRLRLGPSTMGVRVNYELPLANAENLWAPPARLMLRYKHLCQYTMHPCFYADVLCPPQLPKSFRSEFAIGPGHMI